MRNIFNVDRCTHRYLIEKISKTLHPKVMLTSRYVNFHKRLTTSLKLCVRLLARLCETDQRTVIAKTLSRLSIITGDNNIGELTVNSTKKKMSYYDVPENEA